jgi:hypothetical protein
MQHLAHIGHGRDALDGRGFKKAGQHHDGAPREHLVALVRIVENCPGRVPELILALPICQGIVAMANTGRVEDVHRAKGCTPPRRVLEQLPLHVVDQHAVTPCLQLGFSPQALARARGTKNQRVPQLRLRGLGMQRQKAFVFILAQE